MLMSDHKRTDAEATVTDLVCQADQGALSNWDRASAVYEHKSLVTLESKSGFRFVEFRTLGVR